MIFVVGLSGERRWVRGIGLAFEHEENLSVPRWVPEKEYTWMPVESA